MEQTPEQFFEELDRLYAAGNMEDVEQFLMVSGRKFAPCCGGFNETYLAVLSELGGFYRGTSRYRASIDAFEAARGVIEQFLGRQSVEYATNINNMAGTYRLMGENEKALELFQEALSIYEATVGKKTYLYASALNNMALLYQNMNDYEKTVDCLKQALSITENLPDCEEEVATTYTNLCALYQRMDLKEEAEEALAKALSIYEGFPDGSPHYAAALNLRAAGEYNSGDYDAAARTYLKTLELTDRFFGHNIEYGITCENLKRVYEQMGQFEKAEEYMKKAVDVYESVYGKDHPSSRKATAAIEELEAKRNSCAL